MGRNLIFFRRTLQCLPKFLAGLKNLNLPPWNRYTPEIKFFWKRIIYCYLGLYFTLLDKNFSFGSHFSKSKSIALSKPVKWKRTCQEILPKWWQEGCSWAVEGQSVSQLCQESAEVVWEYPEAFKKTKTLNQIKFWKPMSGRLRKISMPTKIQESIIQEGGMNRYQYCYGL